MMNSLPETAVYEIRIEGYLDSQRASQFEGMTVTYLPPNITLLTGVVVDQAALFGLLNRIRDLGTPLISVNQR
jgi:hypothetical protein